MKSPGQQIKRFIAAAVIALAICGLIASRLNSSVTIASGEFHQVAHKGMGRAVILRLANGDRELRLIGFRTYPACDLEVRLIAAPDAFDNETVDKSDPIPLGELQMIDGVQTYTLPVDLQLTQYRAVTIWSRKYRVNFTTAPLVLH